MTDKQDESVVDALMTRATAKHRTRPLSGWPLTSQHSGRESAREQRARLGWPELTTEQMDRNLEDCLDNLVDSE